MPTHVRFIVRSPHDTVLDTAALSVRVRTGTGSVGLRAGMEAAVLPIESGLIWVRVDDRVTLVGSAGGLLYTDGIEATLFTPLAVVGADVSAIQTALDAALRDPESELAARARFDRVQTRVLDELIRQPPDGGRGARAGS